MWQAQKERRSFQRPGTSGGVVKTTSTTPEKYPALYHHQQLHSGRPPAPHHTKPEPISAEIYIYLSKLFLHETPRKKTSKQSSVDTGTDANFKRKREREREREREVHTEAIRERSSATEEQTMMFVQARMRETRNRKSAHRQKRRRRRCQDPSPPDKPTKQGQSVNRHAPSGPSRMDRWMVSGNETVFCWVPVP